MKLFYSLILWLTVSIPLVAQVVTTNPAFPTESGSVTIYFDASQGNKGLENYSGDVYAHTGVITDKSTGSSDWKYVKTNWGENTADTKLSRTGTNSYLLTIDNPLDYYGVPEGETIQKLAFVFRSGDTVNGSYKEGKDDGNSDIFIDIFSKGLVVTFVTPENRVSIAEPTASYDILITAYYAGSGTLSMRLFVNETEVASIDNDSLSYQLDATTIDNYSLMAVAFDDENRADTAYAKLVVADPNKVAQRPTNMEDGITIIDSETVTFSLFAPYKSYVHLLGDINDWQADLSYQLNKEVHNADSAWFWITIDGLTPGQDYGFQYLVDGKIRVADPYSALVLDPYNDTYIPEETFPNLTPYPTGKTDFQISVVNTQPEEYQWQKTDFAPPPKEELIVYELLLRDFIEEMNYQTLTDTLDYLENLGVNAIELMPVNEFDGNDSWGYNPQFHMALDKAYGTSYQFKRFIDEAHKRGIAVILDVVFNHATGASPIIRLYNEGDYGAPTEENPYANADADPNTDGYQARHPYNVFYDLNHESPAMKYYLDKVNRYWIKEYNIDGYRFDLTKGFTQVNYGNNEGAWSGYDASRVAILKRMVNKIWDVKPNFINIFEHLGSNTEEKELADYGIMLWHKLTEPYNETTMGYHSGSKSNFSTVHFSYRGWDKAHSISYMESHDEERIMFKNISYGAKNGVYNIKNLETALQRTEAVAPFFFLIPGPKILWQFGELGYDFSINYNGRTGKKPIRWDYFELPDRKHLYDIFSALINMRKSHEIFHKTDTDVTFISPSSSIKTVVLKHNGEEVVIVGNFGLSSQEVKTNITTDITYHEFFSGESVSISDSDSTFSFNAGEVRIFSTFQIDNPDSISIITTSERSFENEIPNRTRLLPAWPNPFNPTTTIPFEIGKAEIVTIKVWNLLGQQVRVLVNQQRFSAGSHTLTFEASHLSSGTYFIEMQTSDYRAVMKVLLIK